MNRLKGYTNGTSGNGNGYHAPGTNGHAPRTDEAYKLPPQNQEAERCLLGSLLIDRKQFDDVLMIVKVEDFYRDAHQIVFQSLRDLYNAGKPTDTAIVAEDLTRCGEFIRIGGNDFLADLCNAVPTPCNAPYYANIIKEKSIARKLIESANETLRDGYSGRFTAEELTEAAEQRVFAVSNQQLQGMTRAAAEIAPEFTALIERRARGECAGITSGIRQVDDLTCGFGAGNYVIIGARTSVGKTALALNMIDHLCVDKRNPALYVTLEMSELEVFERLVVSRARVDGECVRRGRFSDRTLEEIHYTTQEVSDSPLVIDHTASRTATEILANARRHKSRNGITIVFVDLINHIRGIDLQMDRRLQMGEASKIFKRMARELAIPVVVLAQINRQPDGREDKRPRKSDLKECGDLEEDADMVLLIHRPDYYDPNDQPGTARIIVDKNRNGPVGDAEVIFKKSIMRFEDKPEPVPDWPQGERPAF